MAVKAPVKPIRWAGPYTSGEIPLPFTVKFDEIDIDFSGFTTEATLVDDDGTEMAYAGTVTFEDIATGLVRVDLGAADVAVPVGRLIITRRLQIWAGDAGTNKVATVVVKYNCHPSVGTPPTI